MTMTDETPVPYVSNKRMAVYQGSCIDVLKGLPDQIFDSVVTDPPYAIDNGSDMLGQIAHNWHDKGSHTRGYYDNDNREFQKWCEEWAAECFRVLKPGGYMAAFGGTRTFHRLAAGIEDAGFDIRDCMSWIYGGGFPKGLKVAQAVEKKLGAEAAEEWQDWSTTIRPAWEPIILARKPVEGLVVDNVLAFGTGAMNIGATRVEGDRWTPNVAVDEEVASELGVPSRFFFQSKAGKDERPSYERPDGSKVTHPTVKPLDLMEWLVKMLTKEGGLVLDPFGGSGATVEAALRSGFRCVTVERNTEYLPLIEARIARTTTTTT